MFTWQQVDQHWNLPPMESANRPIFLLACVWRSGSTLTQRLLCSSAEALLWGEPFAQAQIIQSLAQSARFLLHNGGWEAGFFPTRSVSPESQKQFFKGLSSKWIANVYPDPLHLRASYRAMLDRLFAQPAYDLGFERFGIKAVRLNLEHAQFLKWIYPDARFVFLIRDPWRCWNSYCGNRWIYSWPNLWVDKPLPFAKIWHRNVTQFLQWEDPSLLIVKYEDILTDPDQVERLREHCGLNQILQSVLSQKIRGFNIKNKPVSPQDVKTISKICEPVAQHFGYSAPL